MFRKIVIIFCLATFAPAAVGAQELAALSAPSSPVQAQTGADSIRLFPTSTAAEPTLVAAVDQQPCQPCPACAEAAPAKRTHTGLTFSEFVDVHFGEYRWVYWVGAAAVIAAIHVFAAD